MAQESERFVLAKFERELNEPGSPDNGKKAIFEEIGVIHPHILKFYKGKRKGIPVLFYDMSKNGMHWNFNYCIAFFNEEEIIRLNGESNSVSDALKVGAEAASKAGFAFDRGANYIRTGYLCAFCNTRRNSFLNGKQALEDEIASITCLLSC